MQNLVRKPERNRPLVRPNLRWENNSRMNLREIGWDDVDWKLLAQDRDQRQVVVNNVMNFLVP
jgi:hypothetical protein